MDDGADPRRGESCDCGGIAAGRLCSPLCGKRVLILIGGHLATAPRPQKEARALRAAGAEVLVRGTWWSERLAEEDKELAAGIGVEYRPVVDVRPQSRSRFVIRLKQRLAREIFMRLNVAVPHVFGLGGPEFLRDALRLNADLVIAHSEATMWVATRLSKKAKRVGVDLEDWFSEDLSLEARRQRPVKQLRQLEKRLLREAGCTFCPSRAMSAAMSTEFNCRPPKVIYNAFPWVDRNLMDGLRKDRRSGVRLSIHWYSQTIGVGRGLEDLFAALADLRCEAEIHLRGSKASGFDDWMQERVPKDWQNRIFLHPPVSNKELLSRIAEHDIGFAGEMKLSRSRDLTVTNKILEYLLAGLAVVASDTAGQREIAAHAPCAVSLYESGRPHELGERLNQLLASPARLQAAKAAALQAAEQQFCWERVAPSLVMDVEQAVRD